MGPFLKSKDTSKKIMLRELLSLIPLMIFLFYINGVQSFIKEGKILNLFYPLIFILIILLSSFIFEMLYNKIDKNNKYNPIPYLFLSIIIPINTKIYLVILSVFITFITKLIQDKINKNIFNPCIIGYIFLLPFIPNLNFKYNLIYIIILLISFIYLTITKTIKYKISISYIFTVLLMTYVISNYIENPSIIMLSIGVIFNSIYLSTYIGCVTPIGQILQGILLGIFTVLFMFLKIDIIFAILIISLLIPLLDNIGAISRFNIIKSLLPFLIVWIIIILICLIIPKIDNNIIVENYINKLIF